MIGGSFADLGQRAVHEPVVQEFPAARRASTTGRAASMCWFAFARSAMPRVPIVWMPCAAAHRRAARSSRAAIS